MLDENVWLNHWIDLCHKSNKGRVNTGNVGSRSVLQNVTILVYHKYRESPSSFFSFSTDFV